ncbi:MAG: hypothetical protein ACRDMV_01120 [Streptosporangiales bacterium]
MTRPYGAPDACTDCGTAFSARRYMARGMCIRCYARHRHRGELTDYERISWTRDEFLDEYQLLRGEGLNRRQIAERLGWRRSRLDAALARAAKDGDPRSDARPRRTEAKGDAA